MWTLIDKNTRKNTILKETTGETSSSGRFRRKPLVSINNTDTRAVSTLVISSVQLDDCVREFKIDMKSDENDRYEYHSSELVELKCERINKEFLLILAFLFIIFLLGISIVGIILPSYKACKKYSKKSSR